MQHTRRFIETDRLILRDWTEEDLIPFARMNSDDQVMRYFMKKLTKDESVAYMERIKEEIAARGYGFYAVERKEDGKLLGFTGLHDIPFDADFTPAVEIGWRYLPEAWGHGYATEAAIACLEYAKETLKLTRIYAFTALVNTPSEKVMQRAGMKKVKEFEHPSVPPGHWLQKHVLYAIEF